MKWYVALGRKLGTTRWFPRFARHWLGATDLAIHTLSRGRFALSPRAFHVGILHTTGAQTGKTRRVPLYFGSLDGDLIVAASNYGTGTVPGWAFNLRREPVAKVELEGRAISVRAREAQPAERKRLWQVLDDVFPAYAAYRQRVDGIPLFVLEPFDSAR